MADTDYIVAESTMVDEINFIETNAEEIKDRLIDNFEEYLGEALFPGDERRIYLQSFAYILANSMIAINETGRGNLLRYAIGNQLDGLGTDIFLNPRLEAEYATVTMEFTLSNTQKEDIVIPAGTRVTPDGKIYFATDEDIVYPANSVTLTKEVSATATEPGASHNDFDIGQINKLVDTIAYVHSVSNITVSGGGSDTETDEEYRDRLHESPFAFSVAGPANAYKAIAMAASADVMDASVYSPSAGVVEIAIVKDNGEIPAGDDELLKIIMDACSDKTVRPLTDNVRVVPATAVTININVTYYVANGDTSKNEAILAAVEEYKAWQTGKIQRDINPGKLVALMQEAGAGWVDITEPKYRALAESEIAQIGTVSISNGGSINM